ncbi:glycosyltransferase family A protein [Cyclobacterium sp. 1_MG-2023]|uniref:glycosyltransferase family 2 protein n=1 Tax=Cyclobacterium sp. 1_MG-2023 TaxID=3062681 RepID=UPI0026E42503|nr:glycosyltransferase family A protein [Cyclobacterium sp. 1_MG-2023]MDO6440367.1 glycosyltransferase family A protein [Cyclobacterium sp. 1_MG-2023]
MFSIIIPLYNKIGFISRALDSVVNQTYKEYEIIVVNDGSTDGSEKIVQNNFGDKVKVINQKNQGVSTARNTGIAHAKYPYIAFLDADDIWHPDYLYSVNKTIEANEYPGILGTNFIRFKSFEELDLPNYPDVDAIPVKNYSIAEYFNKTINHTLIFTSCIVMKKEFFDTNAGFDPPLKFGEDLDVWFRAILLYGKLVYVQKKLVYYSREDLSAATKKDYLLEQTLIPKILNPDFFPLDKIENPKDAKAFKSYRSKWICLGMPPIYRLKENEASINQVIPQIGNKFFFYKWYYLLPFSITYKTFRSKYPHKLWVKYLKFCYRCF